MEAGVFAWWAAALFPVSIVKVGPEGLGTRVLLIPGVFASIMIAVLHGPASRKALSLRLGWVRYVSGGAVCAVLVIATLSRLGEWKRVSFLAESAVKAVDSGYGEGETLAIALLPRPREGHEPFRPDCAFFAFTRPFSRKKHHVYMLENIYEPPFLDSGPLHSVDAFCKALLFWDQKRMDFADRMPRERKDERIPLQSLKPGKGKIEYTDKGITFSSGEGGWGYVFLPFPGRDPESIEGIELELDSPSKDLDLVLCWWGPEGTEWGLKGLPREDPRKLGPYFSANFFPRTRERNVWVCACGNHAGFYALKKWGRPVPIAIAFRGSGLVEAGAWKGRLKRVSWTPGGITRVSREKPFLPFPKEWQGDARMIIYTQQKVFSFVFKASRGGCTRIPGDILEYLFFVSRIAPGTRIYFYSERLHSKDWLLGSLERTYVFPCEINR